MKRVSKTAKVLAYVKKNPIAKAKDVAQALGIPVNTVYQVVHLAKKKLNGQVVSVLTPNAQASLALFGDKEIQRASKTVNSVPPQRGRLRMGEHTFFATSNRPILPKSLKDAFDAVNHPPHYKVGGIETIDFIEAKSLSYNLGNVVKYITRADHKGNKIEDLKKAQWYLNREVQTMEKAK
jgi:hypothetical protein